MPNPVVHFEIAGRDGEALETFYRDLFDWKIERREAGGFPYGFVSTGGEGDVPGGIRHEPEGKAEVSSTWRSRTWRRPSPKRRDWEAPFGSHR